MKNHLWQIQPVAEAETVLEELYNAPEDSKTEEIVKQEYYSEPKPAEVQEFTEPEIVSQPIGFTPSQPSDEQVSSVEPENVTETSLETEQPLNQNRKLLIGKLLKKNLLFNPKLPKQLLKNRKL